MQGDKWQWMLDCKTWPLIPFLIIIINCRIILKSQSTKYQLVVSDGRSPPFKKRSRREGFRVHFFHLTSLITIMLYMTDEIYSVHIIISR